MFAFALALFQGLAAIPKILGYLKEFAAGIVAWYVNQAEQETLKQIADAAAQSAAAKTQEERYAAIERWKEALSRKRYTP